MLTVEHKRVSRDWGAIDMWIVHASGEHADFSSFQPEGGRWDYYTVESVSSAVNTYLNAKSEAKRQELAGKTVSDQQADDLLRTWNEGYDAGWANCASLVPPQPFVLTVEEMKALAKMPERYPATLSLDPTPEMRRLDDLGLINLGVRFPDRVSRAVLTVAGFYAKDWMKKHPRPVVE
jgi:hypothetical protein